MEFSGLVPYHPPNGCFWKHIPKVDSYRDDVPCQICDMICTSFPPPQVLELDDERVPCIKFKNIVKIIKHRDYEQSQSVMTNAIISILQDESGFSLMCPPDYTTRTCFAVDYNERDFEKIHCFIRNGANPKDPATLKALLDKKSICNSPHQAFLGEKRILELASYNMNENDFVTVDAYDERASISHFEARKVKEQLACNVGFCDIKEIRERVKDAVKTRDGIYVGGRILSGRSMSRKCMKEMLEDWLEVDLSAYNDDIRSLMLEFRNVSDSK